MTKVAEQFNVSSSYLARVCAALNVPKPGRGYWAKLAVGAASSQIPLPAARAGDQLSWAPGQELAPIAKPRPWMNESDRQSLSRELEHWLIRSARQHFDNSRPMKDGDYIKPYKNLLVDITSSKACLEKAFSFSSTLFNALESAGHRVMLATSPGMHRGKIDEHEVHRRQQSYRYPSLWTPRKPTVVYVGEVALGLAIVEMSEDVLMRYVDGTYIRDTDYKPPKASRYYVDRTWTTMQSIPSGRLRLTAYCPSWRVTWSTEWQETSKSPLENSLRMILKTVEGSAGMLMEKLTAAERAAEAEHLRQLAAIENHKREEDLRKVAQSLKDSQEHLARVIQQWANAKNIEQFLLGVEEKVTRLPGEAQQAVLDRITLARELLGPLDPMKFLLDWKSPSELYQPQYMVSTDAAKKN
ncbi:hypothetical protein [Hyphomicrobium sp. DY-1]|uniref:hypothetical protein n=1 Tax=Hyphomicrobium sp. DY-1 TaxID=3075650 RepID=UPI0039C0CB14